MDLLFPSIASRVGPQADTLDLVLSEGEDSTLPLFYYFADCGGEPQFSCSPGISDSHT